MRIELKMKIHTPYGKTDKMILKDGEILFVTRVKKQDKSYPYKTEYIDREHSLGECTIYVEEDEPPECNNDDGGGW